MTSVRGVACLVVLLGHVLKGFHYALPQDGVGVAGPMRALVSGALNSDGAVRLFFVLSGCVLSLSLQRVGRIDASTVLRFYIKRAFRIYPMLWLSLPLAVASVLALRGSFGDELYAGWLGRNLQSPIGWRETLLSVAGLYTRFNGPIWSLRVELVWSVVFPLVFVLVRWPRTRWLAVGGFLLLALAPTRHEFGLSFGFSFAAGACIPFLRGTGVHRTGMALALSVLLFDRMLLQPWSVAERYLDVIEASASVVIVWHLYRSGRRRLVLEHPVFVRIGEWSYSIYLLHMPILLLEVAGGSVWGVDLMLHSPVLAPLLLGVSTIVLTLLGSCLCHRYCELPMQQLGRRVAGGLFGAESPRPGGASGAALDQGQA